MLLWSQEIMCCSGCLCSGRMNAELPAMRRNAVIFLRLFSVAAVFSDCPRSTFSLLASPVCTSMSSKWRQHKKERRNIRDPNYCFLSFSHTETWTCKSCLWHQPFVVVHITSEENSKLRWFGTEEYQTVSNHVVYSGDFGYCVCACIPKEVREQQLRQCTL